MRKRTLDDPVPAKRRWDRIMEKLAAGADIHDLAEAYHTDAATIRVYELVRTGKTSHITGTEGRKSEGALFAPEKMDIIRELYEKGAPRDFIAQAAGLPPRRLRDAIEILRMRGMKSPKERMREEGAALEARVIAAYESGLHGAKKVAKALGIDERAARRIIKNRYYKKRGQSHG